MEYGDSHRYPRAEELHLDPKALSEALGIDNPPDEYRTLLDRISAARIAMAALEAEGT